MSNGRSSERSREVRIGLVMYGGVSLAVYINGTAQEFYQAVCGNGVYRLIKELTDSEIILDIISGSSAGGINGILLSYALANGKDFTRCSPLWRNAADIRKLVRSPFRGGLATRSVLDSEGYYQSELENAFRMLDNSTAQAQAPSPIRELDLFITGTNIEGALYSRVDEAGHVISLKDHRAVFQLKHRQGRKSNFDASSNPAVITALSKLARITSCFPGAFAPVYVPYSITTRDSSRMNANELLQYWGNLKQEGYYIDGGVIDNKPFTHTIGQIFQRTADREVERRLYYVEPDPERFDRPSTPQNESLEPPSFLKPIIDSLVAIPGYESIADDLKLLASRNQDIHRYRRVVQDLGEAYSAAGADYGVDVPADLPEPLQSIYRRSRFASISDRVLAGIFRNSTSGESPQLDRQRALLIRVFDQRTKASPQTLRDFDVYFRLRRVFHLVDYIYTLLYRSETELVSPAYKETYKTILQTLNQHVKRLTIICTAMERLVDEVDYGWSDEHENDPSAIWDNVQAALHRLLHGEGLDKQLDDLNELNRMLRIRVENSKANTFDVPAFRSILLAADELESVAIIGRLGAGDRVVQRYRAFNLMDGHLYPIEWVSGLREKDVVDICRISPADAQRGFSNKPAAEKISGDSLAHFSAFFKRTWRSNDILWGRMDGLCQLVETLLTKEKISDAMRRDESRLRARSALLPAAGPSPIEEWFKYASPGAIAAIKNFVDAVTSEDPVQREAAIQSFSSDDDSSRQDTRDLLIEMAQFRILHECLPDLFEDSIREQAEWNHSRKRNTRRVQRLEWTGRDVVGAGPAFEAFSSAGGRQILEDLRRGPGEELWPQKSALGQSFRNFSVGTEEILDGGVPPLILAEVASRSLLVLRNCLLGSLRPSIAEKIQAGAIYRWVIDMPMRAFYGMVLFLKSAPTYKAAIVATLSCLSVFALFVGIHWRQSVIKPGGNLNLLWFSIFIVAPLAILMTEMFLLSRAPLQRTSLTGRVQNALTLILLAAPLFSVALLYLGLTDVLLEWLSGEVTGTDSSYYTTIWMFFLYGVVPFVLSFLGGYLAVREARSRRVEPSSLRDLLERLTDSELQDITDRMGHRFTVKEYTRRNIASAIVSKAREDGELGKLERAIHASSAVMD